MIKHSVYFVVVLLWLNGSGQIWAQGTETQPMEQRITMITLGVADMESATHFYENQFGWTRSGMSNEQLIVYELPGLHLEKRWQKTPLSRSQGRDFPVSPCRTMYVVRLRSISSSANCGKGVSGLSRNRKKCSGEDIAAM